MNGTGVHAKISNTVWLLDFQVTGIDISVFGRFVLFRKINKEYPFLLIGTLTSLFQLLDHLSQPTGCSFNILRL